jgi:hypothetical protein
MTESGQRGARFLAAFTLLALFAFLAWRSSPWLQEIPWLPAWVGEWADRHGDLRNLPAFAGLGLGLITVLGLRAGLIIGLGAAIGLEVMQLWIPSRFFSWMDIVASCAGVGLAAGMLVLLKNLRSIIYEKGRAKSGDRENKSARPDRPDA